MKTAIVLIAHGTVDRLDDLPAFLANIRHGHAPSAGLVDEVRRHYEAIGGRSPMNAVCREVAKKLEARLGLPTRVAMRLWKPTPLEVLEELSRDGATRVVVIPLAQHSADVYADAVREAARDLASNTGVTLQLATAPNWGREPALTRAFAAEARRTLESIPSGARAKTTLLMTAHSLPLAVIRGGDPYETEVRASAEAVAASVGGLVAHWELAFQSQGMSTGPGGRPMPWLGPDLRAALEGAVARGHTHVVVHPIGFLADHVEVLYDLDIVAQGLAKGLGLELARTRSLNASDGLIDALVNVAQPLLAPK
jgi:ferrochelatase